MDGYESTTSEIFHREANNRTPQRHDRICEETVFDTDNPLRTPQRYERMCEETGFGNDNHLRHINARTPLRQLLEGGHPHNYEGGQPPNYEYLEERTDSSIAKTTVRKFQQSRINTIF